ncbi:isopeptide-forming domain-containing fimbrial protein [Weissella kandleri]|uniref:isopeptide-forming domain-containing fimbrial protein n=1 Tax=Weissella kandleri TaxID=1616 RepID=UPI00387EDAED
MINDDVPGGVDVDAASVKVYDNAGNDITKQVNVAVTGNNIKVSSKDPYHINLKYNESVKVEFQAKVNDSAVGSVIENIANITGDTPTGTPATDDPNVDVPKVDEPSTPEKPGNDKPDKPSQPSTPGATIIDIIVKGADSVLPDTAAKRLALAGIISVVMASIVGLIVWKKRK